MICCLHFGYEQIIEHLSITRQRSGNVLKAIKNILYGLGLAAVGLVTYLLTRRGGGSGADADFDGAEQRLGESRERLDGNIERTKNIRKGVERSEQASERIKRGTATAKEGLGEARSAAAKLERFIRRNRE